MPILRNWDISLTIDHVLRAQGSDPTAIRIRKPALVEIAQWALKEGMPLLDPLVLFKKLTVHSFRHDRLELYSESKDNSPLYLLSGPLIAQHLGPAERAIVLVCTIGATLERIAAELMGTDPLQGWALDSFGSAAVEALATSAANYFEAQASDEKLQTTLPLSPGMIGWPVEIGQPQIFTILDTSEIDVSLNTSFLMSPSKTLSMVIGLGANVSSDSRTCDYCTLSEVCKFQNHYLSHTNISHSLE